MTYAAVRKLFEYRRPRNVALGDIPLLNSVLRAERGEGRPTSRVDVEALLLDFCPEYQRYTTQEQVEILDHSSTLAGGRS